MYGSRCVSLGFFSLSSPQVRSGNKDLRQRFNKDIIHIKFEVIIVLFGNDFTGSRIWSVAEEIIEIGAL